MPAGFKKVKRHEEAIYITAVDFFHNLKLTTHLIHTYFVYLEHVLI